MEESSPDPFHNIVRQICMIVRKKTISAFILSAFFTVFNVGLPFVMYFCPMMSASSRCECNDIASDAPGITFPHGGCCNHHLLAERNTNPFVTPAKYQAVIHDATFALPFAGTASDTRFPSNPSSPFRDTGPLIAEPPLYILSSSLLI